jgi:hypothetical protein
MDWEACMALKWIGLIALPAWSLFFAAQCGTAGAQQIAIRDQLVGTWELVSVTSEADDGKKGEPFGPNPKGIIIFTNGGHFSLFQSKAEIPRIAANDRAKATPEEALAIVASSIAYYGTYTVSEVDKTILVKVNVSTFANVAGGPEQKRIITSLTPDELKFTNPRTPAGVTLQTAWKRSTAR